MLMTVVVIQGASIIEMNMNETGGQAGYMFSTMTKTPTGTARTAIRATQNFRCLMSFLSCRQTNENRKQVQPKRKNHWAADVNPDET